MKNKKIKNTSKVLTISMLMVLATMPITTNKVSAYTQQNSSEINMNIMLEAVQKRKSGMMKYGSYIQELDKYIKKIDTNKSIDNIKAEIIEKAKSLQKQYEKSLGASKVSNQIINQTIIEEETNSQELINKTINSIDRFMKKKNLEIEGINPNKEESGLNSTTAKALLGEKYETQLSGNIYYAKVDESGNPTSDKWVILLPGTLMNKQAMTDEIGYMYLDKGINVLSVDSRQEANGKMGFADALDAWDWINYLNDSYNNCGEIIVHGVSSGATATLYLSGMKIDGQDIKNKKVIGIVEDSGYTSMIENITDMIHLDKGNELIAKSIGVANKDEIDFSNSTDEELRDLIINKVDVGLTEENFEKYQNSLNSLKVSRVPVLVIHGREDTTVPVKHSEQIYETAMKNDNIPYVQKFDAEGENHAFIVLGNKYNIYKGHIEEFVKQAEEIASGKQVEKQSKYQEEQERQQTMTTGLIKALKSIRNVLK